MLSICELCIKDASNKSDLIFFLSGPLSDFSAFRFRLLVSLCTGEGGAASAKAGDELHPNETGVQEEV